MTGFLVLAAALVLAASAVLLAPLWRGNARGLALGIAATLAISAAALYRLVGTPAALDPQALEAPDTLEDAVARLESELARDPRQPDGWRLLGEAYTAQGRAEAAREAYAKAAELAPDNPDVLVEAAQARALAAPERRFDARAVAMLERAVTLQPAHQRARWFLGIAHRQAGRNAEAARVWEALLPQVDAQVAASLRPQIDAARQAAGLPPLPAAAATPAAPALTVQVRLDPALAARARLPDDATVFVIARAAGGPPMPVAVERRPLRDLPLEASLDDRDSPMPTARLSTLAEVEVIARISRSGDAMPQPGDLESPPVRVRLPAAAPVELTIARVRE